MRRVLAAVLAAVLGDALTTASLQDHFLQSVWHARALSKANGRRCGAKVHIPKNKLRR